MTQVLKVTKSGYNAITETDNDNLVFSSDYGTLKYYTTGTITINVNYANYYHTTPAVPPFFPATYSNRAVGTVTHNLGYTPYFATYLAGAVGSEAVQLPLYFGDFIFWSMYSSYADSSKLYFVVQFNTETTSGTFDITFSYRIFKNNLGL